MKGLWELDLRTSSSVYAKARTAIWPWADPDVAAVSEGCDIDLDWLLRVTNTLYLATPLAHQDRLAPVLGGLIADLVNQAFERVSRLRQRLDPTLLLVVDEAANTPLRKLPEWASTVAGIGIQLVTVWQSKSRLEAIYGAQADTILTSHLTKLFFRGMSDAAGLKYVGRLTGDEHVPGYLGSDRPDAAERVTPTQVALLAPNSSGRCAQATLSWFTARFHRPTSVPRRRRPEPSPRTDGTPLPRVAPRRACPPS